jgi:hypothetical protein
MGGDLEEFRIRVLEFEKKKTHPIWYGVFSK